MSLRYVKGGSRERVGLSPRDAKSHSSKNRLPKNRPSHHRSPSDEPRRKGPGLLVIAMGLGALAGLAAALWTTTKEPPAEASAQRLEAPAVPEPSTETALSDETTPAAPVEDAVEPMAERPPVVVKRTVTDRIRSGETLSVALTRHGVEMEEVNRLVVALKGKLDMRGIRPGDVYVVEEVVCGEAPKNACQGEETASEGPKLAMDRFEFKPASFLGAPVTIRAVRQADSTNDKGEVVAGSYEVSKEETPVETKVVALGGEISSSLYVAMVGQGEDSNLVNRFVDVFAWDIDFYRETQKGDHYKVIVEKQYAGGRFIGYGRVLAAEYVNAGTVHRGFNFKSTDGKVAGIFDDKGKAMEKTFLKNPLEIARISSRYGQRFHPVLKRRQKHNGIDYGAARGTPFWAVADGTIKEARYSRTAGNMIVLRHANGYETEYFHASRFAEGIRTGTRVKQRQVIGYVGNTGRSTGPHLHFGMRRVGSYVDPAKQNFPAAKPVPDAYLTEYLEFIKPLFAELEAVEIA